MKGATHKIAHRLFGFAGAGGMLLATGLFLLSGCKPKEIPPPADRLTVRWNAPTNTMYVGDQVALEMTAYYPTNGVLQLPEIGRGKEVVLLNQETTPIPREDGLKQTRTRFLLTSFRLGTHPITDGKIVCRVGEQTFETNVPPFKLHVVSSLKGDSEEIADIKPLQRLPGRVPPWLWIVVGAALLAFLIGLLTSKFRKKVQEEKPAPPPIPPHIRALQALDELVAKGLLEKNECDPFYTELSAILREYLEGRFHLNAPEQTTEEIVEELSRSPILSGRHRNILLEFLRQADMVKFAKGHPDRSTMERAFDTAKHFVEETKETETSTPENTQISEGGEQ